MPIERPAWVKDKKVADDFEVIRCKPFDDWKDWRQDNGCYVLIRVYFDAIVVVGNKSTTPSGI